MNTTKGTQLPTWEEYLLANPCKPYEQSEKFADYDQRKWQHEDDLAKEWLKMHGKKHFGIEEHKP
jgi:hypothetical protein